MDSCQNELITCFGFSKTYGAALHFFQLCRSHSEMSSRRSHDSQISLSQASHIETKNKEGSVKSKGKCRVKDKQMPNNKKKKAKETYKQAGKHILFWVVYWPFVILVLIGLFGHQRQIGVRDVVVIEATMQTAG